MADIQGNLVSLTFKPRPQLSGPLASYELQRVAQEEIARDLQSLADAANVNTVTLAREISTRLADLRGVRSFVDEGDSNDHAARIPWAYSGLFPPIAVSMNRMKGPSHLAEWSESGNTYFTQDKRCRFDSKYGQVLLPYDVVANMVYGVDTRTGSVRLASNVATTVTTVTSGGSTSEGNAKFAFDGREDHYWIHKVRFPVDSDVEEVEVTIQIDLPRDFATDVNLISVDPYPVGLLDITGAQYSTTSADPSTTLTGFTEVRNASHTRWHFASLAMTKFKLTLKQRNWVEEEGWKVFYVGLREVNFQLVKFDSRADTNGIVFKLTAPTGLRFRNLKRWHSEPTPADGTMRVRVYTDVTLSTNVWDSTDGLPQNGTAIDMSGFQSVWVKITMDRASDGVSPVLEWFSVDHNLEDSDGNALGDAGDLGNLLISREAFVHAGAMRASTTSGASGPTQVEYTTNDQDLAHMDFDGTSIEYAQFTYAFPTGYDGGTVRARFYWTSAAGTAAQKVRWGIQGRGYASDDPIDASWGTAKEITSTLTAVNDVVDEGDDSEWTDPMTLAGSPAGGRLAQFRLFRDPTNAADNMSGGDARLIGVMIRYTATLNFS